MALLVLNHVSSSTFISLLFCSIGILTCCFIFAEFNAVLTFAFAIIDVNFDSATSFGLCCLRLGLKHHLENSYSIFNMSCLLGLMLWGFASVKNNDSFTSGPDSCSLRSEH